MLFLLVIPALLAVVAMQRYLAIYAPSNILIRYVRTSPARLRTVAGLTALVAGLILVMRAVQLGISAGGPGWLNLFVLLLAWDVIKIGALACCVAIRAALHRGCRTVPQGPGSGSAKHSPVDRGSIVVRRRDAARH